MTALPESTESLVPHGAPVGRLAVIAAHVLEWRDIRESCGLAMARGVRLAYGASEVEPIVRGALEDTEWLVAVVDALRREVGELPLDVSDAFAAPLAWRVVHVDEYARLTALALAASNARGGA